MSKKRDTYVVSVHEAADQRRHPVFAMFDRPVAFHRAFVTLTGSITAALMLSQAVYWSQRTSNSAGWFYKTASEWEEETGLTRREQETARKRLRQFDWWQEELHKANGVPTLHFRIEANGFSQSVKMGLAELVKPVSTNAPIPGVSTNAPIPITETTSKTTTNSGDGGNWVDVVKVYEHEIGMVSETISAQMGDAYDELGATMLIDAIKQAARNNIRKWSYVDGILKRWKANGRASPHDGGDSWQQLSNNLPDYMKG